MEYLPDFTVLRPASIEDAVNQYQAHPEARYLAGGTDLMVNIRRGIEAPETLIELGGIEEMTRIEETGNGYRIGAGVTLDTLLRHSAITNAYPAIAEAAAEVAAPTHRQVATVGGNLCLDTRCVFYNQSEWWRGANNYCLKNLGDTCHVAPSGKQCFAAFSGDLAPALLVFHAEAELIGPEGRRTIPLGDLYADDGAAHLLLRRGEILAAVLLPEAGGLRSGYAKARVRESIDFPLAGVAMALGGDGGGLADVRLAVTGLKSRPVLLEGTDALNGHAPDEEALDTLTALLPKQIKPMTSTFTPPGYRRKVAANLCRALANRLNYG